MFTNKLYTNIQNGFKSNVCKNDIYIKKEKDEFLFHTVLDIIIRNSWDRKFSCIFPPQ